jgi:hypothetical protein
MDSASLQCRKDIERSLTVSLFFKAFRQADAGLDFVGYLTPSFARFCAQLGELLLKLDKNLSTKLY